MSIPLTINGAVFNYPQTFDEGWGVDATGWAQAVTNGALYLSGGNFPLTAAVDFGSSFGMSVKSITSKTANPATAGYLLLAKTDAIEWRNNTNTGNLALGIDSSNNLTFNGTILGTTSLTNAHIFVGNASNLPADVAMSGDATIANTGALTIANSAITNAKVSASAAIALSKLGTTTASRALVSDSGGLIAPSAVTSTELGYVSGVTSSIQTQLGTLLPLIGGTMSGAISMASNKITSLANGTNPGDAVALNQLTSALKILQWVIYTSSTPGTSSSTSYFSQVAGTITPTSASSRVLVLGTITLFNSNFSGESAVASILRAGVDLSAGGGFARLGGTSGSSTTAPCCLTYIDSPATTSSTLYSLSTKSLNGGSAVGSTTGTMVLILAEIV